MVRTSKFIFYDMMMISVLYYTDQYSELKFYCSLMKNSPCHSTQTHYPDSQPT